MSTPTSAAGAASSPQSGAADDPVSAAFVGLIINQTQMALMLLGAVPHPETGQRLQDLDGARVFIDQLEALEQRTRGNLIPAESRLLRESLTSLRMAFVDTMNRAPASGASPATAPGAPAEPAPAPPAAAEDAESRKKFTKKY